jgi:nicotinamidase-related amidase
MNPVAIHARPFDFTLQPGKAALVIIDMQRDFIEPGGFGDSLGNDVSHLASAVAPTRALLDAWRARGWPVVHTRESHAPDLSDCPPAKRHRGSPRLRIGDPGPMGRLLVRGEPGCEIVPALAPQTGEIVIDKPGKANDRGYDSLLVDEATASYFPAFKAATVEMVVAQGGIVGWVASLATVLAALPSLAPGPAAR